MRPIARMASCLAFLIAAVMLPATARAQAITLEYTRFDPATPAVVPLGMVRARMVDATTTLLVDRLAIASRS